MNATPDNTLADPEQTIADLRRQLAEREAELAQCKAERDEALEQQTATAEVLQVINSSPGDLTLVFEAMLERAMRLCGAEFGEFFVTEGERLRAVAARGVPAEFVEFRHRNLPRGPTPGSITARILAGEPVIHVADVKDDDFYWRGDPHRRALVDLGGARTFVSVALLKDRVPLGSINIYRQEVRPFSDKQIALLENFAAQAVIAMENARLLTETREALEQQTATTEVLQVINSLPGDLAPVFDAMLEKAMRLCGASFGSLYTYDGERFHSAAQRGVPPAYAAYRAENPPLLSTPGGAPALLLETRRPLHVLDLRLHEINRPDFPNVRAMVGLGGIRTSLAVPLIKDDAFLGMITIYRQEVRAFSDKQIALLENFASQAVFAMENARLITETREALEQQTATAEVLQVINSSPGDLQPVFEAILEKAHNLCGVASGALQLYDGEKFRAVATNGLPEPLAKWLRDGWPPGSSQQRVVAGEADVIHIADLAASDSPRARHVAEIGGVRTLLYVALRKDQRLLGVISASRFEVRPFSEKEIALLQNFAAQAVIAMENARLLDELRERTHQLEQSLEYQTATSDVLQVISRSTFDLKSVLDTVIHTAARLCQAEVGHIATRDGDVYRPLATFGVSPPEGDAVIQTRVFQADNTTVTGHVVSERKVIHVADVQTDPAYASSPVVVRSTGVRTILGVPLLRLGEPIGVLSLGRWRVEPFADRQIELVRTFADQAVVAMENARLLGELRQRTDEVVELNRGLEARVAEQVEELGRVGRLKRFLAPQLAELIVSQGNEQILESHRREIVVAFCDLRGYTSFSETAEPEEVLEFLREYHGALGPLVAQFEGTLDQFSGDGIMVFFNDPVPCADPAERAVMMAMAMRDAAGALLAKWRRRGRELGFGAGIAQGYATLGQIGFAERSGYTAIGTVCNLAARLCGEAKDGQILVAQRVAIEVEKITTLKEIGALALKGLTQPVVAYNVPLVGGQAAFRVIEGGPPSA